jgi:nucleoside-diphosphate-sugar epimerase
MNKFLVTGGAGFIGSNIVEGLLKRGENVRVIDNFSTGCIDNLEPFRDKVEIITGDLRNIEQVRKALDGVDYVLHQAAIPSVPRSIIDPLSVNTSNVDGTLNLLIASKDLGIKRVVIASSSSVYGDSEKLPKLEDLPPNPLSPYAATKYFGEVYGKLFFSIYGLETVSLRYFNVFGPRQNPDSQYAAVIPKFIKKMLRGEPPIIYGDGKQTRDFTYVENVVEANLLAVFSNNVGHGEVLNVGCGYSASLNKLVKMINEIAGTKIKPKYEKPRLGDVKHSLASIEKAQRMISYTVKVNIEEGLKKTIERYKEVLKFG